MHEGYCRWKLSSVNTIHGSTPVYIHELVIRARQPSSVAQLVRALHRNRRVAGSIPARDLKLYFSFLFLFRSNKCIQIPTRQFPSAIYPSNMVSLPNIPLINHITSLIECHQACYNNREEAVRTQFVDRLRMNRFVTTCLQTCNNLCIVTCVDHV